MGLDDNLLAVYESFMGERHPPSADRFKGLFRAVVVETNDPLNMHRIRFRMPEMHDFDLKPEDCPWAVSSFEHGGKGTGSFTNPAIGDIIWITFEKNHYYNPIWMGHAEPTRRRYFKLHPIYNKVQIPVDEEGNPDSKPTDEPLEEYLPKDGRPYAQGVKNRYGTLFILNEVGYFPKEHDVEPAPVGTDPITQGQFQVQKSKPEKNKPDRKMASFFTKYGNYMVLSDVGYKWDNEFEGDFEKDYDKEKKRHKNLIKLLNEDEPESINRDQRRIEFRTDYGHKLELRDVGWAQPGPKPSQSRAQDLFEEEKQKSEFTRRDERWLKLRTKGGMLLQFMDMGNNPASDTFIRRKRIEEVGGKVDKEDDSWQNRDARQMRFVSRYGFKFVLDDRGSDEIQADALEKPHGNGLLLKGRRKPNYSSWISSGPEEPPLRTVPPPSEGYTPKHGDSGTERGFGIDINEKDPFNRLLLYSPSAKCLELNDRYSYVMLCTDMTAPISKPWKYLQENEFATSISMTHKPEDTTWHLKLDRANEYAVLGSPMQQTFEVRDGHVAPNEAFIEMRDVRDRATVHSEELKLSAFHDPQDSGESKKFFVLDDKNKWILLHNNEGKIQVYSKEKIEIKSEQDINFHTLKNFTIKCKQFAVDADGSKFSVDSAGFGGNKDLFADKSYAFHVGCEEGGGAGPNSPKDCNAPDVNKEQTPKMKPSNRKKKVNGSFAEESEEKVKGKE